MPTPVAEGELVADKYRVERVLGEGGMGVVVCAWHQELEKRVAIKFLLAPIAQNPAAAERFRREARAAAKIRSEHVARVLDVGTLDNGIPYMVMEYLDGQDLGKELLSRQRIPVMEAIDYVLQACEALAEAHVNSIVHRDLKPENLFLTTRADGSRMIKVLDFGVSKSLVDSDGGHLALTRTSVLVGSPLYMSPEQLDAARDIDQRADIWALGVILYELITGDVPFSASSIAQLVGAVMQGAPRPLAELGVQVPDGLEAVIHGALQKDRSHRYASVGELARALGDFAPVNSVSSVVRIGRVLGTTDRSSAVSAESMAQTQAAASDVTASVGTRDSWGRTSDPQQLANKSGPPRRLWLWALTAVPLLAAGTYLALPVPTAAEMEAEQGAIPDQSAPEAHASETAATPAAQSAPRPENVPAQEPPEPAAQSSAVKSVSTPRPTRKAQPPRAVANSKTAARTTHSTPPRNPPETRAERPAAPTTHQPSSATPAAGVTDFGGRR